MKLTLIQKLLLIALAGAVLLWAIPRMVGGADTDGGDIVTGLP